MKECDNSKIHISSNFILSVSLLIMFDTLLLRPSLHCNTSLYFITLHHTSPNYTSLHFAILHHTSPHFTQIPFTTLRYTSSHFTTLHPTIFDVIIFIMFWGKFVIPAAVVCDQLSSAYSRSPEFVLWFEYGITRHYFSHGLLYSQQAAIYLTFKNRASYI
jgi:hypothetical protein